MEILVLLDYFCGVLRTLISLMSLAFQMQQVETCAVLVTCVSAGSSEGSRVGTWYKKCVYLRLLKRETTYPHPNADLPCNQSAL